MVVDKQILDNSDAGLGLEKVDVTLLHHETLSYAWRNKAEPDEQELGRHGI